MEDVAVAMIKITTDRQPWAAGRPLDKGAEVDVSAEEAEALVAAGFAELLVKDADAAPARRRRGDAAL